MKTLCLLATHRGVLPLTLEGRTVDEWISSALDRSLPGVPRVAVGPWSRASQMVADLTKVSQGYDEVFLTSVDAPFLRQEEVAQMRALHREYRADYTFADGFPTGLTGEFFHPRILPVLAEWAGDRPATDRDTLFQLLSIDINRFDVETFLSPVDLRSRRLSLTADSRRNGLLLERYASDSHRSTRELLEVLEATEDRSRTLPATLHVQVTDGVLQVPVWSPLLQWAPEALSQRQFLPRDRWNALLDRSLAWAGDLTVLPSFWGEPSLHPDIVGLLCDALGKPGLRVCLETSGLGWAHHDLERLIPLAGDRIDWIVELDSNDPATYQSLRGPGFEEAQAFVRRLLALFPGQVWPQTVRMAANEGEMEGFHKFWKAEAGQVIIQKHNDFGGRLPRAKPSDLSPWKRHPCWHLARDLAVFLDGTTVVCRDDYARTQSLGNAWTEEFPTIWARGEVLFRRHVGGDWPEVCRNCDEWYTFHF